MNPTPSSIEPDVDALIRAALGLPAGRKVPLVRADIEQWDSLKHMEIILALEDRFGVMFHEDEFPALDSTAAIAAAVCKHLAA